eukprot:EG_transcript_8001
MPGESWLLLLHLAEVAMGHLCGGAPLLHPSEREPNRLAVTHVITLGELNHDYFTRRSPGGCSVVMADICEPERPDLPLVVSATEALVRHFSRLAERPGANVAFCQRWVLELANYLAVAGEFHGAAELLRGFVPAATRRALGDDADIDGCWHVAASLQLAPELDEETFVLVLSKISDIITTKSYTNTFIPKEDFNSGLAAAYGLEALRRARQLGIDGDFALSAALAAAGASLALSAQAASYRRLSPHWNRRLPKVSQQFAEAKDALEECIELRHRQNDPEIARALHALGELYFCAATANLVGLSCFQGVPSAVLAHVSLRHLHEAKDVYEASGRVLSVEYADLLKDLGKVLLYSGCPEEGGLWLQRSFRLHRALCGAAHPRSRNVLALLTAAGDEEGEVREEEASSEEE